jgi:hypothetical protein
MIVLQVEQSGVRWVEIAEFGVKTTGISTLQRFLERVGGVNHPGQRQIEGSVE